MSGRGEQLCWKAPEIVPFQAKPCQVPGVLNGRCEFQEQSQVPGWPIECNYLGLFNKGCELQEHSDEGPGGL